MSGLFGDLTPEQRKAALAYDGPESHGDPVAARARPADADLRPVDPYAARPDRPILGSHTHWHGAGRPMEMLEFNRLQSTMPDDGHRVPEEQTAKLCEHAAKAGRTDAEEFLEAGDFDAEAWAAFKERAMRGAYLFDVDVSERTLARTGGGETRKQGAAEVCGRVRSAYFLGCEQAYAAALKRERSGPRP